MSSPPIPYKTHDGKVLWVDFRKPLMLDGDNFPYSANSQQKPKPQVTKLPITSSSGTSKSMKPLLTPETAQRLAQRSPESRDRILSVASKLIVKKLVRAGKLLVTSSGPSPAKRNPSPTQDEE